MKEIRLYIYTNAPVRGTDRRIYAYLMQYVRDGQETGARDDRAVIESNQKGATLEAMIASLTRINDGNEIPVSIICHCPGVITAINQSQFDAWSRNGWRNAKGAEVEHADKWQRVKALIDSKAPHIIARPPGSGEEEIMQKLGAEMYEGRINLPHPSKVQCGVAI